MGQNYLPNRHRLQTLRLHLNLLRLHQNYLLQHRLRRHRHHRLRLLLYHSQWAL